MATTTLLAGSASSTAGDGRYTVLTIRIGNGSMETEFFGWTYGIPVLIALGVLFAVTVGALWWIARPAVPSDLVLRELERAARRNRTRTVLALAVGATSFTLGQSWLIIGRSAALSAGVSISESTQIDVVTPFAVLSIPFMLLGFLLEGIGLALLLLPLFQPGHRPVSTGASRRGAQAPTERVP